PPSTGAPLRRQGTPSFNRDRPPPSTGAPRPSTGNPVLQQGPTPSVDRSTPSFRGGGGPGFASAPLCPGSGVSPGLRAAVHPVVARVARRALGSAARARTRVDRVVERLRARVHAVAGLEAARRRRVPLV